MPRVARIVIAGLPHHITQRGNNQQEAFLCDKDRHVYVHFLAQYAREFGLIVDAYCLMPNHVHLVATPREVTSLASVVGLTHQRYAQYFNLEHERSGHLWQSRFFSCALDEAHYWSALCYVERNPVRAGLAHQAWDYPWSSAAAHVGAHDTTSLLDVEAWRGSVGFEAWKEQLGHSQPDDRLQSLRTNTRTGRPLGGEAFLRDLERVLGRRLQPLPVGRPRK